MDVTTIGPFSGNWFFLSNFFPSPVNIDGVEYATVEHAYQSARCAFEPDRAAVLAAGTAGEAKRLGRAVKQRTDWELVKTAVMLRLIRAKFADAELSALLVATAPNRLVEFNDWGDTFWGVYNGEGQNRLGMLLELVRGELILRHNE